MPQVNLLSTMHSPVLALVASVLAVGAHGLANFPHEAVQLEDRDIGDFSAIAFGGNSLARRGEQPKCRAFPGSEDWPATDEWDRLNTTLNGALLKPVPAASVCYAGPNHDEDQCNFLLTDASATLFYNNDPLTVLSQWTQGNTCLAAEDPAGNCTHGGFPVYVVNVTTTKDVQAAVNFARNWNIRLVIK